MAMRMPMLALGLMSGTSCDGVDAALLTTDGLAHVETGPALSHPYPEDFRRRHGRRGLKCGLPVL